MTLFPAWARASESLRIKRLFDLAATSVGLVIAAPIVAVTAAAIRASMGSPVLFRQDRPGYQGRPFTLLKFRTMRPPSEGEVWFRSDDARLTRVGRLVRKLSLDELPTLWNVWRGDMSLVGPRPLLMEYLEKYTAEEHRRHDVPPGITGWAQIHGRQSIPFSRRLALDLWYVDHRDLWLDLKTLLATPLGVFGGKGVISGQNVDEVDDLGLSADVKRKESVSDSSLR